ncbi:MAG: hypothetical protein QM775_27685 [Pirellulales bacterium]
MVGGVDLVFESARDLFEGFDLPVEIDDRSGLRRDTAFEQVVVGGEL